MILEALKAAAERQSGLTSFDVMDCRRLSNETLEAVAEHRPGLTSLDVASWGKPPTRRWRLWLGMAWVHLLVCVLARLVNIGEGVGARVYVSGSGWKVAFARAVRR